MFMTKKQKVYKSYLLVSDYINNNWQSLFQILYDLDSEPGSFCCMSALCLYVGVHLKDYHYPLDMFKINFADHPDYMQLIEEAYSELYNYASTEEAASYHQNIDFRSQMERIKQGPQCVIYDSYYGKIIYAMIHFSKDNGAYFRHYMTTDDFIDSAYNFFVSKETSVKQLVSQVKQYIG